MRPYCITFAGAVGSSKTTIANFLSKNLNLRVLSNDTMRLEVVKSLGKFDQNYYERKREQKLDDLLKAKTSFIYDASVDRRWQELKSKLVDNHYDWFVISLDFSKELIQKLLLGRGDDPSIADKYFIDHQNFLNKFGHSVNLNLSDEDFGNRLDLSLTAVNNWLKTR